MKQLSPTRQFLFFLFGVTVFRLLWHLLLNPVGIMGDEAYNWDWGRHLAWGYYSKPPGSAWLHALVGFVSNDSLFAIKATSTLLAGGSALFFFLTLRHVFSERFAYWVGLIYLLCPGQQMVSSILTADAQLLLYWNLALFASARILFPKNENPPNFLNFFLLFLALALGHLAKQMMLIQIPLLLMAVALIRPTLFKNPLLYLVPIASLVSLIPPLYWNAQNDWITVEHTAHHFDSEEFSILDILERFGALLSLSAILLTPLAVAAIPRSLKLWMREKRKVDPKTLFFILYGALPFAVMFAMTLRQDVNPNWPAAYHGGTLALAGIFFAFKGEDLTKAWRVSMRIAVGLTAMVVVGFPAAEFLFKVTPLKAQRRTYWGYPELSANIASHNPDGDHAIIVLGHRDGASEFAFNMPGKPEVHVWNEGDTIAHQYDFWPGPEVGTPTLLIIEQRRERDVAEITDRMRESFDEFEFLAEYGLHPSRDYPRFKVYRTSPLKSWPSPVESSRR
ncbi:ArnT family glycosyltransferase [Roseibacillus persicicus]|uniref:Dolichyl-phosphate-mannose--protein mannosyltransferase n=1 Tax=Roseibacillus persicicus TaxID=454148 RepID=A0A918U0Y9_9BACT|nr:glycosyltransferase family 39 protein [Roseibacillus persicicus]GHC65388.1 dolichyl-phosphate-mannose--protein mannosyltransferase [Roseibacillus persicicus]